MLLTNKDPKIEKYNPDVPPGVIADRSWKFYENPFFRASVILLTNTDYPKEIEQLRTQEDKFVTL